ncbi:unnamed protein product, partial [Nesidiocoris tenuis]
QYDQKNIRRRVYDALNVLMAMNIISKERKEIRWLGLPATSAQENVSLLNEKKQIAERIRQKRQQLNDLLIQVPVDCYQIELLRKIFLRNAILCKC